MSKSCLLSLLTRECGRTPLIDRKMLCDGEPRIFSSWIKRPINAGFRDKIFASKWLSGDQILFGTKCNNLVLLDITTGETAEVPLMGGLSRLYSDPGSPLGGIHAIQLNPSQTLVAAGATSDNNMGVYTVSDMQPFCLLQGCHRDCVFDFRWLDDSSLISCSRDSTLALWRLQHSCYNSNGDESPIKQKLPAAVTHSFYSDDRFRALEYLPSFKTVAVVSMSQRFYLYDAVLMGMSRRSPPLLTLSLRNAYMDTVALRRWPSNENCIALASNRSVILFDIRCSNDVGATGQCIDATEDVRGIRSLNFLDNVLSYGTANGSIYFYDLRKNNHLLNRLDIGEGWVRAREDDDDDSTNSSGSTTTPAIARFNVSNFRRNIRIRPSVSAALASQGESSSATSPNENNNFVLEHANFSFADSSAFHRIRRCNFRCTVECDWDSETGLVESVAVNTLAPLNRYTGIGADLTSTSHVPNFFLPARPFGMCYSLCDNHIYNHPLSYLTTDRELLAVYTHEYDPTGLRLFAAGGPIASTYYGNVAAVWD